MTCPGRLVLVVGTGTEVGKTYVSALVARAVISRGRRVLARKPAQSFESDEDPGATDAAVLARATGEDPDRVCPPARSYPLALAPPMAADALGLPPFSIEELAAGITWPADAADALGIVETAGGVRSPQASDGDAVDLARVLGPDLVVLVAPAGLGTINSVRSSADALFAGSLPSPLVVLNRFDPSEEVCRRNRVWLESNDRFSVVGLPADLDELVERVLETPPF